MTGATLRKDITPTQLFSLAFGSIIGVGWITVPGLWVEVVRETWTVG